MTDSDRYFMELAVTEARKCEPKDSPNAPYVAAVATRGDKVLGTAYRGEIEPGEHAEYTLLEKKLADVSLTGATVYITLEPCTTRNEPKKACVEWLIRHKVSRVVIGIVDPNPVVRGKGYKKLRDAGIEVEFFDSDLIAQLEELNLLFFQSIESDYLSNATDEIVEIASRSGTPDQCKATMTAIHDCLASVRRIRRGQIPILGGDMGYFEHILSLVHKHPKPEHIKVFVMVTPFEITKQFDRFEIPGFIDQMCNIVESGKVKIEYILLLSSEESLQKQDVVSFIERFKKYSSEIRLVYRDKTQLMHEDIQVSMALLSSQHIGFTHMRDNSGNILNPVKWIAPEDYLRLHEQYDRIKIASHPHFTSNVPKKTIRSVAKSVAGSMQDVFGISRGLNK